MVCLDNYINKGEGNMILILQIAWVLLAVTAGVALGRILFKMWTN